MPELTEQWRTAFFQTVCQHKHASLLKEASLKGQLGQWTTTLTEVAVNTCQVIGWQAAAKGHKLDLLPESRHEYLALDVMAFAPGEGRWRFPVAVIELENSQAQNRIAYSLWKVLCTRADLRLVFCYRRSPAEIGPLVLFLQNEVIESMGLSSRMALAGQTLVVVGSRAEADTFPYGFFKWWELETNTGRFEPI